MVPLPLIIATMALVAAIKLLPLIVTVPLAFIALYIGYHWGRPIARFVTHPYVGAVYREITHHSARTCANFTPRPTQVTPIKSVHRRRAA